MEQGFVDILKKMVDEQGKETLFNAPKCKSLLADYAKNEYKKEIRFLLLATDAGTPKAIDTSQELPICKKQQIRLLHEEYGLAENLATSVVNTLALVLRGDTARTEIQSIDSKSKQSNSDIFAPSASNEPQTAFEHKMKQDNKTNSTVYAKYTPSIRFDGVYYQEGQDSTSYIRFYDDGTVITVSSTGTTTQIKPWFTKYHKDISTGRFNITGNNISFQSTDKCGSVDYSGKMSNDELLLDIHSNINGYIANNQLYLFCKW